MGAGAGGGEHRKAYFSEAYGGQTQVPPWLFAQRPPTVEEVGGAPGPNGREGGQGGAGGSGGRRITYEYVPPAGTVESWGQDSYGDGAVEEETIRDYGDGCLVDFRDVPHFPDDGEVCHLNAFNNDLRSLGGVGRFSMVVRLTVSSNNLNSLDGCQSLRHLRWLDASANDIEALDCDLSACSSLQWLDLNSNDLKRLDGIENCPRLTFLNVSRNFLTSLQPIQRLVELQWLDASHNDLVDIEAATTSRTLVCLSLAFNNIAGRSVLQFADQPRMQSLILKGNDIPPDICESLESGFGCRPGVTLVLRGNDSDDEEEAAGCCSSCQIA